LWLIVGLGNPGMKYGRTRHNIGFRLIDLLGKELGISVKKRQCHASIGHAWFYGEDLILVKPQTFMNLSGISVKCLIEEYGVDLSKILIVYDDKDLKVGQMRIRTRGSNGGHKGMGSVINELGTSEIPRLRIGIGCNDPDIATVDFVLGTFSKEDESVITGVLEKGVEAVLAIVKEGLDAAMSRYNG
jgi:PTH1 family peptidyl-tRNA hydrolase